MSQIPGDYNSQNLEDWSLNNTSNEPSDLSKIANSSQTSESIQENSPLQSFEKINHTEESILRSAVISDSLTEAEFKKSKWKDALETTGKMGRLKYKWNKVKSSMHAFISGFEKRRPVGNLKSRAKNSLDDIGFFVKNKTTSSLPTSCCTSSKKETKVTPEMLSLYMDGIELGDIEHEIFQGKEDSAESLSENNLLKNIPTNIAISSGIETVIPINSMSYFSLNNVVNYGQYATFNSNELESQALFRRLSILENSSSIEASSTSFVNPKQIVLEEIPREEFTIEKEVKEKSGFGVKEKANNSETIQKKKNVLKSSNNKKQESKKKFQFFTQIPPHGLPLLVGSETGTWGASSHTSFRVPQSGHQTVPIVNFSSWGKKNRRFLNSSDSEEVVSVNNNALITNTKGLQQEVNTGISVINDKDIYFINTSNNSVLQKSYNKDLSFSKKSFIKDYSNQDNEYLVSSAYSFLGFSGFSAESMQKKEEEQLLTEQQKAATFANVLVYQYRTIGLNPPIVLRRPSSYASSERPYVIKKPSAEEAHNEKNQEDGYDNNDNVFNDKKK